MNVAAPWGLLAALTLVPLVAAYFLRRKQPPLRVSALFLWRAPTVRAEGGPRLHRLSRERSLLLEAAAILLATVFLADLRCGKPPALRQPLAVVLDGSLSMSAHRPGDPSAADRARGEVERRLASAGPVTVIASGPAPQILAGPGTPEGRVRPALEAFAPGEGAHALDASLELARAVSGASRVLLLTDHVPEEPLPTWVELQALGEPLENDAITFASRRDEGAQARVVLRISHFGASPAQVRVLLHGPSSDTDGVGGTPYREERVVSLGPGEGRLIQASLDHVGPLEVSLSADALPADGQLSLAPEAERPVGVAIAGDLPAAERAALARFVQVQPDVFEDVAAPALRFGLRTAKDADVTLGAPGTQRAFLGPFFVEKSNALVEDVETRGVVWSAGESPPGRPLIAAGGRVLLAEEESGRLHLNVDLARSNLTRASVWPIVLSNIVRRARAHLPGFPRRQQLLGEEIRVVVPAEGRHVLIAPGDRRTPLRAGELLLSASAGAGTYHLVREGRTVDTLVVHPVDAAESDLRGLSSTRREAVAGAGRSVPVDTGPRPVWPLAGMLALLLLDYRWTREGA